MGLKDLIILIRMLMQLEDLFLVVNSFGVELLWLMSFGIKVLLMVEQVLSIWLLDMLGIGWGRVVIMVCMVRDGIEVFCEFLSFRVVSFFIMGMQSWFVIFCIIGLIYLMVWFWIFLLVLFSVFMIVLIVCVDVLQLWVKKLVCVMLKMVRMLFSVMNWKFGLGLLIFWRRILSV